MKVCIVSDSHDNRRLLEIAVRDARQRGAEAVLHCGDVVAPTTLRVLQKHGLPVHVIHGNNTGDLYNMGLLANEPDSVVSYHGQDVGIELAGKRIFIVHYPHYARAIGVTGDWDPPTYVMGDLAKLDFEILPVLVDPGMAYNMPHITAHT